MEKTPGYTKEDLQKVAQEAARNAILQVFAATEVMALDNRTNDSACMPEGEPTDMATYKAKIGNEWVTGNSLQQLVENALKRKEAHDAQEKQTQTITVAQYCNKFMRIYKSGEAVANNTRIGYMGYLRNHILPFMGEMSVDAVTVDTMQMYINEKSQLLAAATIKKHIDFLSMVFDSALEDDIIQKNPFKSSRITVHGKDSEPVLAYTEDEFKTFEEKVLHNLTGSTLLFVAFTLYTGMRLGEICALTWEDVDLENGVIRVSKSVEWPAKNQGTLKTTKTPNGIRCIVILRQLRKILENAKKDGLYIIHGVRAQGDQPASHEVMKRMRERINKIAAKNGVDFHFGNRQGRHTMATFMNNAEMDDKSITGQIGHYDISFTQKQYMNAQMKQTRREMLKLEDYLSSFEYTDEKEKA